MEDDSFVKLLVFKDEATFHMVKLMDVILEYGDQRIHTLSLSMCVILKSQSLQNILSCSANNKWIDFLGLVTEWLLPQ